MVVLGYCLALAMADRNLTKFGLVPIRLRFGLVGNVVGRVNEVNQRRARLVLGWMIVCSRVNNRGM